MPRQVTLVLDKVSLQTTAEGQKCRQDFDAMVCSLTPPTYAPSICALAFDCVPRALSNGRSLPTSTRRPARRKCANYKIHVLSTLTPQNHVMNHGTTMNRTTDRKPTAFARTEHVPFMTICEAQDSPIIERRRQISLVCFCL